MATEAHTAQKLESPAVDLRGVGLAAVGSLLLVGFAIGVLGAVYYWQVPSRPLPAPKAFPAPQLRPNEAEQLRHLLSDQRARLAGYAWADRQQGLVKIPIERAMQLIAQQGDKAYDPLIPPSPALSAPSAGAQRATTGQGAPSGPADNGPGAAPAAPSGAGGKAKP